MYQYRNLEGIPLYDICQCLNCAFSDYALPIHLNEADLSSLFAASGIDKQLSFGAFSQGILVGVMLNSCGLYQGHQAAFDVAAGVIPSHRGNQIFSNLFPLRSRYCSSTR